MAPNAKRVFYVKYLSGPIFADILAKRPDIQLDKLENETPDAEADPVLTQAHAYQIGASRQVIGKHLQVTDALLAKTPNLVAVSSNGAGYDTIDVDACTRNGIIVVNQSGGNKEAVAEHALAMLLTLTKRIIEVDRHLRRSSDIRATRSSAPNCWTRRLASSASAMSVAGWRSCARGCSACACWRTTRT
ncbi:MAG: hypothetical protein WDN25_17260 [Acetobacteraceae bacterium]